MHTEVQWGLLSGRGPHGQVPKDRQGMLGQFSSRQPGCSVRISCGLAVRSFLLPFSHFSSLLLGLHCPLSAPPYSAHVCLPRGPPSPSHPQTSQTSHTTSTLTSHPHAVCNTHMLTSTLHTETCTRALLLGWPPHARKSCFQQSERSFSLLFFSVRTFHLWGWLRWPRCI